MPLLGVHEVVFAPVTEEQAEGSLRFAKLAFEIFLSSFQVLRLGAGLHPPSLDFSLHPDTAISSFPGAASTDWSAPRDYITHAQGGNYLRLF